MSLKLIIKIQYVDQTERQSILDSNKDKVLTEEQNIIEGNFLIFSDIKPIEYQLNDLNNTVSMILLKQEGII